MSSLESDEALSHPTADTSNEVSTNLETANHNFTSLPCTTSSNPVSCRNWLDVADRQYVHDGITPALDPTGFLSSARFYY